MSELPKVDSPCGVAHYEIDGDTLSGRFVLELYGGLVTKEVGTRSQGQTGAIAGTYEIATHTPDRENVFANGTVEFIPFGDQGAYKVVWVLHLTAWAQQVYTMFPATMIYKAVGLATDATHISVGWDNDLFDAG
jgi:hypothetical protein